METRLNPTFNSLTVISDVPDITRDIHLNKAERKKIEQSNNPRAVPRVAEILRMLHTQESAARQARRKAGIANPETEDDLARPFLSDLKIRATAHYLALRSAGLPLTRTFTGTMLHPHHGTPVPFTLSINLAMLGVTIRLTNRPTIVRHVILTRYDTYLLFNDRKATRGFLHNRTAAPMLNEPMISQIYFATKLQPVFERLMVYA